MAYKVSTQVIAAIEEAITRKECVQITPYKGGVKIVTVRRTPVFVESDDAKST